MCARKLLQKLLKKSCFFIHKSRLTTLIDITAGLMKDRRLTMTELGYSLSSQSTTTAKHSIKRVSNFLSNAHMYNEAFDVQKELAHFIMSHLKSIKVIVDWTPANTQSHNVLRANLINKNSSITIYQEVHPESESNNPSIELKFLDTLKQILPNHIENVLIITDAGFYCEWFKKVVSLGFDFIGRVRSTAMVFLKMDEQWQSATKIARNSSNRPKYLGRCSLTKKHKYSVHAYCYKQKLKPLTERSSRKKERLSHNTQKAITSYEEGWFIVTNKPQLDRSTSNVVIDHYKERMKIEAGNRTTKSTKYGFGFEHSMTKLAKRLTILLLIEQIASLAAWIVGYYSETTKNSYLYSNGSSKGKRRLSLINLGLRILNSPVFITTQDIQNIIRKISSSDQESLVEIPGVP